MKRISAGLGARKLVIAGPDIPPYSGMALQGRRMQELLIADGFPTEYAPSNLPFPSGLRFCERLRGVRPFLRSLVFCRRLWKMLADADVLHVLACSWLYFFVVACPAVTLGRLRRKRVILNYRGGEAEAFFRWAAPFAKPFFRMADVVTAPSDFLVEVLGRRLDVPVQVAPNIVDLDAFPYKPRRSVQPKMIVTRHLEALYDVECVIRAFRQVQTRYPQASLVIAGSGSEESRLQKLVSTWNLKNVSFVGYVPHRKLSSLYAECDILLNASRADNFPGSLVEAAVSGLVVVSTNPGGIPYVFESEKNALLVSVGDWAGMAAAVIRVLENPHLAATLTEEALARFRRYEWNSVRTILYRIYGFDEHPDGCQERLTAGAPAGGS
jgi:glycosyltransferase involved in cell wall biosynthesis